MIQFQFSYKLELYFITPIDRIQQKNGRKKSKEAGNPSIKRKITDQFRE